MSTAKKTPQEFFAAIFIGNLPVVKDCIENQGFDVNGLDSTGAERAPLQ
jgi:hypothetical protein